MNAIVYAVRSQLVHRHLAFDQLVLYSFTKSPIKSLIKSPSSSHSNSNQLSLSALCQFFVSQFSKTILANLFARPVVLFRYSVSTVYTFFVSGSIRGKK